MTFPVVSMMGGRRYSPGIMAGEILILEDQYKRLPKDVRSDFVPQRTSRNVTLYRHAKAPVLHSSYDPAQAEREFQEKYGECITDEWWGEFLNLVTRLSIRILAHPTESVFLFEAEDDEEFVYGALVTACANEKKDVSDWLLEREFGNYYSLRHITTADLTEEV